MACFGLVSEMIKFVKGKKGLLLEKAEELEKNLAAMNSHSSDLDSDLYGMMQALHSSLKDKLKGRSRAAGLKLFFREKEQIKNLNNMTQTIAKVKRSSTLRKEMEVIVDLIEVIRGICGDCSKKRKFLLRMSKELKGQLGQLAAKTQLNSQLNLKVETLTRKLQEDVIEKLEIKGKVTQITARLALSKRRDVLLNVLEELTSLENEFERQHQTTSSDNVFSTNTTVTDSSKEETVVTLSPIPTSKDPLGETSSTRDTTPLLLETWQTPGDISCRASPRRNLQLSPIDYGTNTEETLNVTEELSGSRKRPWQTPGDTSCHVSPRRRLELSSDDKGTNTEET